MSRVIVLIEDDKGVEAGLISISSENHHKLIRGLHVYLPLNQVTTPGGVEFSVAGNAHSRDAKGAPSHFSIRAETDVFGGAKKRWRYVSNAFGIALVRRMEECEDAELFRLWIDVASSRPSLVARYMTECTHPDDYRNALLTLRRHLRSGHDSVASSA